MTRLARAGCVDGTITVVFGFYGHLFLLVDRVEPTATGWRLAVLVMVEPTGGGGALGLFRQQVVTWRTELRWYALPN